MSPPARQPASKGPGLRRATMGPAGGVRAHADPVALPSTARPGEPSRNRFDDPDGQFRTRYLATTRRGALLEALAPFRPSPHAEERLRDVVNVEGSDDPEPPGTVPARFIDRLRVARIGPRHAGTWFIDVAAVETHTALGAHPAIAGALRYSSRVDSNEECWAVFDTVEVWAGVPERLAPDDPELGAVYTVLGLQPSSAIR